MEAHRILLLLNSVRDYTPNAPYFSPQNQTQSYASQPNNVASLANNFSQFGFGDVSDNLTESRFC
jgi:hypothetical protein